MWLQSKLFNNATFLVTFDPHWCIIFLNLTLCGAVLTYFFNIHTRRWNRDSSSFFFLSCYLITWLVDTQFFRSLPCKLPSLLPWCVGMSKLTHFDSWRRMSLLAVHNTDKTLIIWHCNLSALKYSALYFSFFAMRALMETYVTPALFQQTHYNKWIWQITAVSDIMPVATGAEAEK